MNNNIDVYKYNINNNKLIISIFFIILFHFSGLIGIQSSYREWFLSFTTLNLLLCTGLLFWNQENIQKKSILSFIVIFILGLIIEIIGVKTGQVFGVYKYGNTFGYKFMDVPFIIGLNWVSLCFSAVMLLKSLKINLILKSALTAFIPLSIDYFIEQVCEKLDFWYWENSVIPIQNFVSWYIFSFIFSIVFELTTQNSINKFSPYFLFVQLLFFVILSYSL